MPSHVPAATGIAVLYHARRVARITRCRRSEARAGRAFNRSVAALSADRRRCGVLDRDGLMHLRAGVPAIIYRMPGLGARCRCHRTSRLLTGIAVLYHARRVARITRCRRGEARAGRAFNRGVAALSADRRRCGVLDRDGLMQLDRWCSRNYLPRARSWCGCRCLRTSRLLTGIAVLYHARGVARIARCRRREARAGRAFNRRVAALSADRRRCGVFDRDGLMHLSAGVPAIIYRVPGLGARVGAVARPGRYWYRCPLPRSRCCTYHSRSAT